ncbi:MAG: FAD-binding domain-containing protein [Polaromonas sp.]
MTTPITALGVPARLEKFEPTPQAALHRLAAVNPPRYAKSRNALDGEVTGLSPYFTHGMLGMADAARDINSRWPLGFDDKLVFEFGWREFFQHVWGHQKNPDAILQNMHDTLPWHGLYADTLPPDIRQGCTGVAVIDNSVRILYATGYLHNHLRMYLASYVVHVRKVHWRAGADWLYGHLLDGDLPSNHLSWQWVAGSFSSKPYLFNADNVLKYAPQAARPAWDCSGTVIDQSYEALDVMARQHGGHGPETGTHEKVPEPPLLSHFYPSNWPVAQSIQGQAAIDNIANKKLELVHPWSLSQRCADDTLHTLRLGIIHLPAHAEWPWSEQRWQFVLQAMALVTDHIWIGDIMQLDTSAASSVTAQATLFPGYRQALSKTAVLKPVSSLLPNPAMACKSFSKFYERAQRDAGQFADFL